MELVFTDAKGVTIGNFHWDVHKLRDIPELIDLVHWSCAAPDRG
jgi:hypothetical protein